VISLSVGDVIAGYRLDELAGRGGMGVVFRATHIALERQGAVKLIAPELAANDEFRQRFQRESRLAASIDHPHVIPIFDAGDEQGQLYVAMRFVEGTDLAALIAGQGSLAPTQAAEVIAQVGDALDAAHERGLVHRDVKPANVLLESRRSGYHAYLTDFGLVKAVGAASGVLTRTGHWLGTPDYAAPEQILGGEVDARTDVYALGCMLYQAITGKPPFERDNDVAKMYAHLSVAPPTLSTARPGVREGLDEVIRTALAKSPEERYRSAGEFVSAARRAIEAPAQGPGEIVAPRSTPPTEAAAAATMPAPDAPSLPPREADVGRPAQRRRRSLVGAAALALLAGGAALALVLTGGDDGGPATAAIPAGNLTGNPSFEQDTSGWDFSGSDITREKASDAPDGESVARVTAAGPQTDYSIDDDPETVSSSSAGRSYTASAWVKATEATDGEKICISLRERPEDGDGEFPFSAASVRASAKEYREVRVTHPAEASGRTIGVHIFRTGGGVSEGEAFLVDAIALTEGGGGSAGTSSAEC
jgi:serine/threonine protein kinase